MAGFRFKARQRANYPTPDDQNYRINSMNWGNFGDSARPPLQNQSCPFKRGPLERWPSGLRRTLGKRVCGKPYRGFESHSLRHAPPPDCFWIARTFGDVRDARLNHEHLFDDPYVVVAGSRSPWSRRRKMAFADLSSEPWTLPPLGSMVGSHLAEAFRASGLEFPRAALITLSPEARFRRLCCVTYKSGHQ